MTTSLHATCAIARAIFCRTITNQVTQAGLRDTSKTSMRRSARTRLTTTSYLARRYGRTILLRANIMRDPNIFESTSGTLAAEIGEQQAKELTPDGNFYRTLWHEVGHYLGVDRTKDGRE